MSAEREVQEQVGFKAPPSKYVAWKEAARLARLSFAAWAARAMDAAMLAGPFGADAGDPDYDTAIAVLRRELPVAGDATLIRLAVKACAARKAAGLPPFRLAESELIGVAESPETPGPPKPRPSRGPR